MALKKMYIAMAAGAIDLPGWNQPVNLRGARGKTSTIYSRGGKVVLFSSKKDADDFITRTGRGDHAMYPMTYQSAMIVWDAPNEHQTTP